MEPLDAQFDQKRFMVGEMPVRGGMADASAARHGPQSERAQRLFFQNATRRLKQSVAQIAMVISALRFGRFALSLCLGVALLVIHDLPLRGPWAAHNP
jgi:hypothetical protein